MERLVEPGFQPDPYLVDQGHHVLEDGVVDLGGLRLALPALLAGSAVDQPALGVQELEGELDLPLLVPGVLAVEGRPQDGLGVGRRAAPEAGGDRAAALALVRELELADLDRTHEGVELNQLAGLPRNGLLEAEVPLLRRLRGDRAGHPYPEKQPENQ